MRIVNAVQRLLDIHTVPVAGRLTVQKASWAENPDPPKSGSSSPPPLWPGYSTLLRAARVPLQPSNCCPHWSNRRNRGTVYAFPDEDAIAEGRMLIAQSGDELQQRASRLLCWPSSVARKSGSCSRPSSYLGHRKVCQTSGAESHIDFAAPGVQGHLQIHCQIREWCTHSALSGNVSRKTSFLMRTVSTRSSTSFGMVEETRIVQPCGAGVSIYAAREHVDLRVCSVRVVVLWEKNPHCNRELPGNTCEPHTEATCDPVRQ